MTASRLIILAVLTVAAVALALALQRRRTDPPSAPSYRAPVQLDRHDFAAARPGRWLVVLFGSSTCDSCPLAWATIQEVLGSPASHGEPTDPMVVDCQRLDVQTDPDLHKRYRIDGVPTTVIADPDGVVVKTFFGPIPAEELADAIGGAG
jgi:thiol-disulfide isomerase/thioredoxin